jgi:hypothetical protein
MASRRSLLSAVFVAGAVVACAKSVPVTTNEPASRAQGAMRWTGALRPPAMASTAVLSRGSPSATAASYGNVMLTRVADQPDRWRYELTVTAPPLSGSQVAWALFTGSCGASSPPVVPTAELPVLDLGSGGGGAVRGEIGATLSARTTYHVNVYTTPRATDVSNVLLCAKLSVSGQR